MNILNLSVGADTGGQGYRFYKAFTKLTDHDYQTLVRSSNYIRYPKHLSWNHYHVAMQNAQVIHANNTLRTLERVQKPMIIHYHGSTFRNKPQSYLTLQDRKRARGIVATLDLLLLAPKKLTWCPAPYDLEWLETFRKPQDGPVRIGHAPTDRNVKSTAQLIEAVNKLKGKAQLVLIERQPWTKCLELKGTVDVLFDQVQLGYGNNAIEAWGMGIPVIAGAQPDTLAVMGDYFGELPFYQATEQTIGDALAALLDETTRKEWGEIGRAHVERFHSDRAVVELMEPIYEKALETFPQPANNNRRRQTDQHRGPNRRR